MAITLTDGSTPVLLSDDLAWSDEYDWQPLEQRTEYAVTGSLLVEVMERQAGRQITLQGADDAGWVSRAQLDDLQAWASTPGIELTLTLRGVARTVMWDIERGAIAARPVCGYSDPIDGDPYVATLRFIEV